MAQFDVKTDSVNSADGTVIGYWAPGLDHSAPNSDLSGLISGELKQFLK